MFQICIIVFDLPGGVDQLLCINRESKTQTVHSSRNNLDGVPCILRVYYTLNMRVWSCP